MIDWLRPDMQDPRIEIGGKMIPLHIRRHPTAKRMTMRMEPDGSAVRISIPRWGRTREALEFARSREEWLGRQLAKSQPRTSVGHGSEIAFRGAPVRIEWDATKPRRVAFAQDALHLGGPEESISARVERWLKAEAKELLHADLAFYCERAEVEAPSLALSSAKRRWGSCSTSGTVRINWRLVMASDEVRRSVVAHEVAHLVHFDHGPQFHAFLASIFEHDIRAADGWLKQHGRSLYRHFG
ncbi:M48 family metallopeptidase [Erythrobacter sp. HKB08]|uniref:M48 family metallopeptidase n=1 Tax=Erythrobacter sp. HKB08 TaxID=2502843 RepID=UPI0010090009|nr:SprT family zinc-dependent metalloprotease [Erythrobacter sp. HKB08]